MKIEEAAKSMAAAEAAMCGDITDQMFGKDEMLIDFVVYIHI